MIIPENVLRDKVSNLTARRDQLAETAVKIDGMILAYGELLAIASAQPAVEAAKVVTFPTGAPYVGSGPNDPDTCQGDVPMEPA